MSFKTKLINNSLKSSNFLSFNLIFITIVLINVHLIDARKHHLVLTNDIRKYFTVSTFGFFTGGSLTIDVDNFSSQPFKDDSIFGFTLAKTMSDSLTPYLEGHEERCLLTEDVTKYNDDNIGLVSILFDFKNNLVSFKCNEKLSKLRLFDEIGSRPKRSNELNKLLFTKHNKNETQIQTNVINNKSEVDTNAVIDSNINDNKVKPIPDEIKSTDKINSESNKDSKQDIKPNEKQNIIIDENNDDKRVDELAQNSDENEKIAEKIEAKGEQINVEQNREIELKSCVIKSVKLFKFGDQSRPQFRFNFAADIVDDSHEGLYNLFFHNCPNYGSHGGFRHLTAINLSMSIIEKNLENYLSAGEIPLPQLYFALSIIFFLVGVIWINVIRNKSGDAFKIHYLMAGLVFVKAFSLLFHGINYHFIAKEGSQVETWAVLYYITHLLKGALLFITIVLIGTGWAFIKHILSDKDKKIFMIVIPLQVLANIADIITEESEEGALIHNMWREIFILVDLLCCGAILFPVVWSIRHLQEASQTDGKAAINLRKLKLFRHFYVMIVCYIYFTRIIVYLLKITVPFQYEWLNVFFQHTATLLFFVLTGYHFQPTSTNPYFQLMETDDDLEMEEEVLFVQPTNGFSETKKRNRDIEADADTERLITKRESSHDFD